MRDASDPLQNNLVQSNLARKLRILATIDTIGIGGGAEQLLATLLPAIKALGHDVSVAPIGDWTPDLRAAFDDAGIPVHYLHANGLRAFTSGVAKLRYVLAAHPVDILWSHSRAANIVARLASIGLRKGPVQVATLHSEGYAALGVLPLKGKVTTRVEKFLLSTPQKVAVSQAVAADYANFFGWKHIAVIPNCFDPRDLLPALSATEATMLRAQHGVAGDDCLFIVPARYVAKKGHAVLLDALEHLARERGFSPRVLCFGVGALRDEIAREAAARGLRLDVLLSAPQRDLFRLMRAADGVVLPSLREPFGIAALEAMALGVPLIASDVDGLHEILSGHDCALTVPPGNAVALADAMWSLREDPATARARADRAQEVARTYEPAAAAQRWSALFAHLTEVPLS